MHDEIKAEFIAIFDADFLPEPGFLMRAIPFFQDKKVGALTLTLTLTLALALIPTLTLIWPWTLT